MTENVDADRVRAWIDDDLVNSVERVPDEAAEFNFAVEMSNIVLHVIRRNPGGPLLIGQQIEYGEEIRSRIQAMSDADRNDLLARIRETLTATPGIYGFHDEHGTNVTFENVYMIFLEHRIYPNETSQHALMTGLVGVWKALRYLDDIVTLIESVQN